MTSKRAMGPGVLIVTLLLGVVPLRALALTCPSADEEEVVRLVNIERDAAGLAPLQTDVRLVEAARLHSQDMANGGFFDHEGSDGSSFWDRCVAAGYPMRSGGENIAAGYPTPADAVEAWMNSPGHRAIILTADFRDIGVGLVFGGSYRTYWTADFGISSDLGDPPPSACASRNEPPVARAEAPSVAPPGTTVSLDGRSSHDADGTIRGYAWVQTLGPPVALSDDRSAICTFVAPGVGSGEELLLEFRLSVEDDGGLQDHQSVTVRVRGGEPVSDGGGGGGGCFLGALRP